MLPAASRTISASRWIVTSSSEPMLKTEPTAFGVASSRSTASTASRTWPKQRACWPLPKTVIGSPASACAAKVGSTMP